MLSPSLSTWKIRQHQYTAIGVYIKVSISNVFFVWLGARECCMLKCYAIMMTTRIAFLHITDALFSHFLLLPPDAILFTFSAKYAMFLMFFTSANEIVLTKRYKHHAIPLPLLTKWVRQ